MKVFAAILFVTFLQARGCVPVPKPGSDETPPEIGFRILNRTTGAKLDIGGSENVFEFLPGDDLRVTMFARDTGGIRRIALGGGGTTACPGTVQNFGYGQQVSEFLPDAEGKVFSYVSLDSPPSSPLNCGVGTTLVSAEINLTGEAENYYRGMTRTTLKLRTRRR
jgi:hypothetical protein